MSDDQIIERAIDAYCEHHSEEETILLLMALAHPEQGGQGYRMALMNPAIDLDGYDVSTQDRVIRLDRRSFWGRNYSARDLSNALHAALEVHVFELRRSLLGRVVSGTGMVLLGTVETAIGVVGILVPEPGTTAGGAVMTVLGINTIGDGVSQIFGANDGRGYNVLAEGSAWVGSNVAQLAGGDRAVGDRYGRIGFAVSSIAVGGWGSFRSLYAPGRVAFGRSPHTYPGLQVGRVDFMFGPGYRHVRSTRQGALTVFNVVNNSNQSILRIVYQALEGGRAHFYINGFIKNVPHGRILRHETNWRRIASGLARLLYHGGKNGW